jgi:hypothetical protein
MQRFAGAAHAFGLFSTNTGRIPIKSHMSFASPTSTFYRFTIGICARASLLLLAGILYALNISPLPLLLLSIATSILALAYQKTTFCLGLFLFIMPMFTLMFMLAEFFGPSYIGKLEGIDRGILLLLVLCLALRNRVRLVTADFLVLACFLFCAMRLPLDGSALSLASDFGFMLVYFAGRLTNITEEQQIRWARIGVWVVAIIAVAGLFEVFGLGEGPRTILYLRVAEDTTVNGTGLNAAFHASGFKGMRESGTMLGPLQFGPLCMIAMILWWIYSRKAVPGIMILAGLVCSLTRSAWVGTFAAILLLAIVMGQIRKTALYGAIALAIIIAAIPFIGIGDYLSNNRARSDTSADQHKDSLEQGLSFVMEHPLGAGANTVGRQALKTNDKAFYFENAYLSLSGAYGIPVVLGLLAFIAELLRLGLRAKNKLGYVVFGILVGFSVELTAVTLHDVFPIACWIWFPAGLLVTEMTKRRPRLAPAAKELQPAQ